MLRLTPIPGGLEVLAPAKLNLFLEVLGKRPDGYHEVETLMVPLTDFWDRLRIFEDESERVAMTCDDATLPTGPENLVIQAAERLKARAGVSRGARIELFKQIPSQGGLAGGSSDAAATLAGLNRLWNLGLSTADLHAVAAEIGSDVAFFLSGSAAVCRGRGERVEAVEGSRTYHFVLVCPREGVSTREAFARVEVPDRPRPIGPVLKAYRSGDSKALGRELFNRLEPAAEGVVPTLRHVRDALQSLGPLLDGSLMSGSGSVYFGLACDRGAAKAAATRLETLGPGQVRVVKCGP